MNGKAMRRIKNDLRNADQDLLIAIRNKYGNKTAGMNMRQVISAAKLLYRECKGDWKLCKK